MDEHEKKKIAPIVVTILVVIYYIVYFAVILKTLTGVYKYLLGLIPLLLGATMVYVCIQRINEIDGGEEDDLSKY